MRDVGNIRTVQSTKEAPSVMTGCKPLIVRMRGYLDDETLRHGEIDLGNISHVVQPGHARQLLITVQDGTTAPRGHS